MSGLTQICHLGPRGTDDKLYELWIKLVSPQNLINIMGPGSNPLDLEWRVEGLAYGRIFYIDLRYDQTVGMFFMLLDTASWHIMAVDQTIAEIRNDFRMELRVGVHHRGGLLLRGTAFFRRPLEPDHMRLNTLSAEQLIPVYCAEYCRLRWPESNSPSLYIRVELRSVQHGNTQGNRLPTGMMQNGPSPTPRSSSSFSQAASSNLLNQPSHSRSPPWAMSGRTSTATVPEVIDVENEAAAKAAMEARPGPSRHHAAPANVPLPPANNTGAGGANRVDVEIPRFGEYRDVGITFGNRFRINPLMKESHVKMAKRHSLRTWLRTYIEVNRHHTCFVLSYIVQSFKNFMASNPHLLGFFPDFPNNIEDTLGIRIRQVATLELATPYIDGEINKVYFNVVLKQNDSSDE